MKVPHLARVASSVLPLWLAAAKVEVRNLRFLDDATPTPVLIGYKSSSSKLKLSTRLQDRIQHSPCLSRVNAAKAQLNKTEVEELAALDDDILYIEEDSLVFPLAEIIPYGIGAVQATAADPPESNRVSACNNPNSFKVGIVDSGKDIRHPDNPCFRVNETDSNCIGNSFGLGLTDEWSKPSDIHGTFRLNLSYPCQPRSFLTLVFPSALRLGCRYFCDRYV